MAVVETPHKFRGEMARNAQLRLILLLLAVGAVVTAAGTSGARSRPRVAYARATMAHSFPCQWNWGLNDGLPAGYVNAGSSADCASDLGSLTLTIRLLSMKAGATRWKTDRLKSRTWRNSRGLKRLGIEKRCDYEKVRAVFWWTLHDGRGALIARHVLRTKALNVPGPGCSYGLTLK